VKADNRRRTKTMRAEQKVHEMVGEVLLRQAEVRARRTAEPLDEARGRP